MIVALAREHRKLLKAFESGNAELDEYLRRWALRHMRKDYISRTFLAIDQPSGEPRVAGFYSLATVSVAHASIIGVESLSGLPRFPIPGILLARLAVDRRAHGQGVGRYLLSDVLRRLLDPGSAAAFRVLVADAIDEAAVRFYEHYDFHRISQEIPARMVLDLKPHIEK